ncbi:hypothetical protein QE361_002127 [Sphingomonas sp. SORGH_AS802]|jgi:hypothetical protein|uniref:hypothetical protein n=1 Tax=unclassified Sphingomonas TaxID=196159 RepID=UPI0028664F12|nr:MULTISPECIES: hypothetical protein [unclassified Sphingomonas]MDR6128668.1 hypothetical protein [Sphingomonas sp. SORGH_AS_0438]MDR6135137.1 hypothetical protein [Sphingomonas sp. SORGH_AS_0802]
MTKDDRAARLAAQLRTNLKRRKAQAREAQGAADAGPADDREGGTEADGQRRTSDPAA